MKSTLISLAATALVAIATTALADDISPASGATSVDEMLQLKREHQLRTQLLQEGRGEEARQLDIVDSVRAKARLQQAYENMNTQLSPSHVDKVLANQCDSEEITTPKKVTNHTETVVGTNSH